MNSTDDSQAPILIVGGGIGGLTLALNFASTEYPLRYI
jgi:2-polyprenyl-6-methoxyphenol hydroxylase-like FAD-dependent oxidoreductase